MIRGGMAQVAALIAMTLFLLGGIVVITNILAVLRRARTQNNTPAPADIRFPQRFKDRVITEKRPIQEAHEEEKAPPKPPMRRADLPPGYMMSHEIVIHVQPDETEPMQPISPFRRYVDKDGTTRRDVRRIIDRLEDIRIAG